jgi:arabinofuranosyltransferase
VFSTNGRARVPLPAYALVALVAVFWWQVALLGDLRIDDAYITFSFSKNLALGHGPVYSHGLRVEGYSNFLWMLLVALPLAFWPCLDPYLIARTLTVPFVLLLGWATYWLIRLPSRGHRAPPLLAWAALVFMVFDTDLVIAAISGLETLPYVALVVAGFALYLRGRAGSLLARALTVPCFVAAALMRIDGFIPLLFMLGWELTAARLDKRFRTGDFLRWAAPSVLVYVLWFAWRWSYYGLPLPTTYYAKALIPAVMPDRGWEYTRDFWLSTGLGLIALFAPLALWRARGKAVLLVLFVIAHTAYVIRVGGDWMPFWRFFAPVVPLVTVLMAWAVAEGIRVTERWHRVAPQMVAAAALACGLWIGRRVDGHFGDTRVERDKLGFASTIRPMIEDNLFPMSRLLNHVVPPGKRLVSDYAGTMAYFTDAAVIDMWGLANQQIALRGTTDGVIPIWGRTCPSCYADLEPDFFHVQFMQSPDAYRDKQSVVAAVWQSDTIGKYVNFGDFVAGRATDLKSGRAVFFLERRRADSVFTPRRPAPNVIIEYPFGSG